MPSRGDARFRRLLGLPASGLTAEAGLRKATARGDRSGLTPEVEQEEMKLRFTKGQEIFFNEVIGLAPDATVAFGEPAHGVYRVRIARATGEPVAMRVRKDELWDIAVPGGEARLSRIRERLKGLLEEK